MFIDITLRYLSSDDKKAKSRAEQQIKHAQRLMERVQIQQEKALENPNKDTERLLKNREAQIQKHQALFDRLETKFGDGHMEFMMSTRLKAAEGNARLENAISNEKLPEEVRAHLQEVKTRIEEHLTEVKARSEEFKNLRDAAQGGDEEAKAKLETLKAERANLIDARMMERKEHMEEIGARVENLKASAEAGDEKAKEILKRINEAPRMMERLDRVKRMPPANADASVTSENNAEIMITPVEIDGRREGSAEINLRPKPLPPVKAGANVKNRVEIKKRTAEPKSE